MRLNFKTAGERVMDERGSVGVLVALVMFFVMGMLMMTWNTAQISKEKMRLQNAVDSAALAHATWQARSMNAVQNLNEEKYFALDLAYALNEIGVIIEGIAQGLHALRYLPFGLGTAFDLLSWVARIAGYAAACTSGWTVHVVVPILDMFQQIYIWCPIAGFMNAQNFATYNGAFALFSTQFTFAGEAAMFTLSTFPITSEYSQLFKLPVEEKTFGSSDRPWVKTSDESSHPYGGDGIFPEGTGVYRAFWAGKPWNVKAYVSPKKGGTEAKNAVLPVPVAWFAMKTGNLIDNVSFKAISGGNYQNIDDMPVFAIGAAQCITGDIVPHVDNTSAKQRPIGFGTGATAKLVPVSEALSKINTTLGNIGNAIIYH